MLAGTQNDAKMSQISMMFPPKTQNCAKNAVFLTDNFFVIFSTVFFHVSLNLGSQNGSQAKNNFNHFRLFSRHFSLSRLFQRFWLISHAQDDQEQPKSMENSMEKDDQNPSQGLPKGSKSSLYGRAVAPALPAQLT